MWLSLSPAHLTKPSPMLAPNAMEPIPSEFELRTRTLCSQACLPLTSLSQAPHSHSVLSSLSPAHLAKPSLALALSAFESIYSLSH